jgi:hypothetical protein
MYNILCEAFTHTDDINCIDSKLQSVSLDISNTDKLFDHPAVFITKWIDYSNKYGLGYQLRDGSVGVYFNDATSIILSGNGK